MTTQASLFDDVAPHPRARAGDTQTALDAAKAQTPGRLEDLIIDLFRREPHPWFMGGMTDDELAARLPREHPPSVKSARSRLSGDGLLVDSGERRPSVRGRQMIVWRLA